jgi:hypothetical protein
MRKLLAFCIILISINQLSAQEGVKVFKPFRVDAALGSANSLSAGTSIGFCLSLEPRYAINDVLHVGLRFEGAAIVKGFYDISSSSQNISSSASGISSYLATGDYYFTTNRFRPYAGAGLGIYDIASAAIDIKDVNQNADYSLAVASLSKFGGMLRTGVEFGHGRLEIAYNMIPKTTIQSDQNTTVVIKQSYLSFKLGVAIGGGRYKK